MDRETVAAMSRLSTESSAERGADIRVAVLGRREDRRCHIMSIQWVTSPAGCALGPAIRRPFGEFRGVMQTQE